MLILEYISTHGTPEWCAARMSARESKGRLLLAVAISFRIAYPLAVTKCQVNVLLLTLNVNTDLRSRLSSPSFQALKLLSCQSCVIVLSRQNTILEHEHGARGELK